MLIWGDIIDVMNVTVGNLGVAHGLHMDPGVKCVMHFDSLNLQIFNKPKMCESSPQSRSRGFGRDREIGESDIEQHRNANHGRRICYGVSIEDLVIYRNHAGG